MDAPELQSLIDEIRRLIAKKLGVRGRSLAQQLRRAGRRLPRNLRRGGEYLVQAKVLVNNPRLARQLDHARAQRAARDLIAHLRQIDPKARRAARLYGIATGVVFNLMLLGAGVLALLYWRQLI
ncbi:MAG: hypothetical protein GC146_00705 [Limimaricola sp.]|uniref:hypothetical protein n=1 Tax=Limimaricola sp. TaxID=2211665 RepID=UPI001D6A6730|nr:hypothetical protein [Limimaricola sp.]MBI1415716.1 hypothetical protein [Limimaricola sp.]